jgi:L-threonylcarbamoyladenylate synthase
MDKKILYWDNLQHLNRIIQTLQDEKNPSVVAATSDTVFGLLAGLFEKSFMVLNRIKKREKKPYLILIGSYERYAKFTDRNNLHIETLLKKCWPGPLTIIVKAADHVPAYMKSKNNTIALRVPDHKGLLTILQKVDGLFSTSANKADELIPQTMDQVDSTILNQVTYVVLDSPEQKIISQSHPSTIIDCSGETIKVVREGAYPIAQLEKIYGSRFS